MVLSCQNKTGPENFFNSDTKFTLYKEQENCLLQKIVEMATVDVGTVLCLI